MSIDISTRKDQSKDSVTAKKHSPEPDAAQVEAYLQNNPEFFVERDDLLVKLSIPHVSGKAISLLERQVTILRDRGIDARHKLNGLLDNARNNEYLFEFIRTLVLSLLKAESLEETVAVAQETLCSLDNITACELILLGDETIEGSPVRRESKEKFVQGYPNVFLLRKTSCESLRPEQIGLFFPRQTQPVRSTAICPIGNGEIIAILALGNESESYFNLNLDTLFLDFIGEVIGAILLRELNQ